MEALTIELYFSIFVGAFMVGMGIFIYIMAKRKMREDAENADKQ